MTVRDEFAKLREMVGELAYPLQVLMEQGLALC
jgi:hypothetical protein